MAILLFLLAGPLAAAEEKQGGFIQHLPAGQVDWTTWRVQATGVRGPEEKSFGKHSVRIEAQAEATKLARERLLKALLALRLNASHLVGDIAKKNPVILSEITDMAKDAQVVRQAYLSDGTINVTVQLDISGGFSQLLLPEDIEQIDPVKTVAQGHRSEASENTGSRIERKIYSGLIVDATGIDILPGMVVRILNENGQEVYGAAFVSREFAVQRGMVRYVRDLTTARCVPEMGGNPLVVKGLRTREPGRTDIIISNADASKIRGTSEHISFLRQGRVLIVSGLPNGSRP